MPTHSTGKQAPQAVKLTPEEAESLRQRIFNNQITPEDRQLILGLISFSLWLQQRLSTAKIKIKQLKKLFGFKREKKPADNEEKAASKESADQTGAVAADSNESSPSPTPTESAPDKALGNHALANPILPAQDRLQWDATKNHGRYGAADYTGCCTVTVPFADETLQAGFCPDCAKDHTAAKLYSEDPMVVVCLTGQPLVSGTRYAFARARCSVCGTRYRASLPQGASQPPKYDAGCYSTLAIHHYYAGMPFHRLATLQATQGVPLADATQFDLMDQLYRRVILPIFNVLETQAAQGQTLYWDDTGNRILTHTATHQQMSTHSTAMVSEYAGQRIYLFYTNEQTAGRQAGQLLAKRNSDKAFTTMCDASPHNFPILSDALLARWVLALCLVHGRRQFYDLIGTFDQESEFVLTQITKVYQHEAHCRQANDSDQERLRYHQQHSAPLMEALRIWLNNQLLYRTVEPNSELGKAIVYTLRRWHWLTQFLKVPGSPLDNNICELAIKVVIRYRKASLFYRTQRGAMIGDAMMSVLHTTAHSGANLFHYLNTLQQYAAQVSAAPQAWLPWNYQESIAADVSSWVINTS